MDALALLCNLYGDGPASLRVLREAGVGSIEAAAGLEAERLAGLLRTSVRAARRFQSEGRLLSERMDPTRTVAPRATQPEPAPQARTAHPDPLLSKVLDAWRERDSAEWAGEPAPAPNPPASAAVDASGAVLDGDVAADAAGLAGKVGEALRAGVLDGLDQGMCGRLARVGVRTVEQLAECDAFELARAAEVTFTPLQRLRQLARRRVQASTQARASDVLYPHPDAARGRRARPAEGEAPTARAVTPRFSPSGGPQEAARGPLQNELDALPRAWDAPPAQPVHVAHPVAPGHSAAPLADAVQPPLGAAASARPRSESSGAAEAEASGPFA